MHIIVYYLEIKQNDSLFLLYNNINGICCWLLSHNLHCFTSLLPCRISFTIDSIYFVHKATSPSRVMRFVDKL